MASSVRMTPATETPWKIGALRRLAQNDGLISSHLLSGDPLEQPLRSPGEDHDQQEEGRGIAERGVEASHDQLGDPKSESDHQDADRVADAADDRRCERLQA